MFGHTYFCHYLLAPAHSGGRGPPVPSPDYEVGIAYKHTPLQLSVFRLILHLHLLHLIGRYGTGNIKKGVFV